MYNNSNLDPANKQLSHTDRIRDENDPINKLPKIVINNAKPPIHINRPAPTAHSNSRPSSKGTAAQEKASRFAYVLRIFTLKEPSALALQEYATREENLKTENSKSNRSSKIACGNTRKLPPSVPKVNTKWDGMPPPSAKPGTSSWSSQRQSLRSGASSSRDATSSITTFGSDGEIFAGNFKGWNRSQNYLRPISGQDSLRDSAYASTGHLETTLALRDQKCRYGFVRVLKGIVGKKGSMEKTPHDYEKG